MILLSSQTPKGEDTDVVFVPHKHLGHARQKLKKENMNSPLHYK